MLTIGDMAPDFLLEANTGKKISLSSYKGKRIVLYFYPKDDTPGCTREAIAFTDKLPRFLDQNTIVLGVSRDSTDSHQKFCAKHNLETLLLSDVSGEMTESYGVWQEKKNYGRTYMGIVRSTYLIDETGSVAKIWKNVKVDGHVEAVLAEVLALKSKV